MRPTFITGFAVLAMLLSLDLVRAAARVHQRKWGISGDVH